MSDPTPAIPLQIDLLPPASSLESKELVAYLQGAGWRSAAVVLRECGLPVTETNKRKLRALAEHSNGQVAGGQKGYKLVREMTREEFMHYRNWMMSQANTMRARVMAADKVFFGRQAV